MGLPIEPQGGSASEFPRPLSLSGTVRLALPRSESVRISDVPCRRTPRTFAGLPEPSYSPALSARWFASDPYSISSASSEPSSGRGRHLVTSFPADFARLPMRGGAEGLTRPFLQRRTSVRSVRSIGSDSHPLESLNGSMRAELPHSAVGGSAFSRVDGQSRVKLVVPVRPLCD